MQPKKDMPMPRKDDNVSKNFGSYKNEEFIQEKQEIEVNHKDLIGESLDI